ncbi:hydroxyacid dehydrogenase [Alphaproteobacteria bacterium]|nr:hydroxyacid dehydrogenase [Alphaproteobacteria bacterium]
MKIAILGTVHPKGLEFLKDNKFEVFEVENFEIQSLKESLKSVDGILLRTSKLDQDILQQCDNLKIISRHGVGYDNVDLDFLNKNKIALGITSTSNAASVSEHVMSFFIYLTKNLSLSDRLVKEGNFDKRSQLPDFFELYKKKVLIIGFGRIGKEVAKRCLGFDMEVYVYDPFLDSDSIEKSKCIPIEKNEGLALADFITIHLPLNENTTNFISKSELNLMKKNTVLVNTSRGGIVNEDDLYQALKVKKIQGAGMDVYTSEPPEPNHPFFKLDNILLTPHNAALTLECRERMSLEASQNIVYFLKNMNELNKENLVNKKYL